MAQHGRDTGSSGSNHLGERHQALRDGAGLLERELRAQALGHAISNQAQHVIAQDGLLWLGRRESPLRAARWHAARATVGHADGTRLPSKVRRTLPASTSTSTPSDNDPAEPLRMLCVLRWAGFVRGSEQGAVRQSVDTCGRFCEKRLQTPHHIPVTVSPQLSRQACKGLWHAQEDNQWQWRRWWTCLQLASVSPGKRQYKCACATLAVRCVYLCVCGNKWLSAPKKRIPVTTRAPTKPRGDESGLGCGVGCHTVWA
jgi:hypothetical protein